jgi:high-affinity Fe2+/Pb2+ permease
MNTMLDLLLKLFKNGMIADTLQNVLQARVENWKMDFYRKLSDILASIVLLIVVSFVFLIMLLFLGFGLSFYLNNVLESTYLGFLIVGFLVLIAAWMMSLSIRTGYLQHKLVKMILKILDKRPEERQY